ncbi:Ig-like domain-containing protein [Shewanella violacea]|uniref:Uncharacterized protein n=1 Tax=Shewanella violacea (strain JCM 10179 / CIP 106290 / LMG 19151 / DSS12) TaxID=637905 RepID=D4ZJT0_SHEVD|nr:tandem-95 repeat protein [Shewanella violacea]BAJ01929.1 hypothetical protein SVI_1958 [Shewanella violacea DSS12]
MTYYKLLQAALLIPLLFTSLTLKAATPVLTNGLPASAFSGEQVCFDVDFSNADPSAGFGPYIRLILPIGISFDSATLLGSAMSVTNIGVFPMSGLLSDPRSATQVSSTEGDSLELLVLALGSVFQNGPALVANICVSLDTSAVINAPLTVGVQGVFQYGDTATGSNGPIIGALVNKDVAPSLYLFDAGNNASEGKSVPGSAFPVVFTDTVNVANGKTLDNLSHQNTLDNALQYISSSAMGGNGFSQDAEPSTSTAGGVLLTSFTDVTGTAADDDIKISYSAYITDILDESQCSGSLLQSDAQFDGEYLSAPLVQGLSNSQLQAKHLVIRHLASTSTALPGDSITFTDSVDLSQYATSDSLVINLDIDDGLTFASHQTMLVNGSPQSITPNVTLNGDGTTSLNYDVHSVTGNIAPGTSIDIVYTATVAQLYIDTGLPVLAADELAINVNVIYGLTAGASACSDSSLGSVSIIPVTNSLAILSPQAEYSPGDIVTLQEVLTIASGDTTSLVFETYLPLPVFDVSDIDINTNLASNTSISFAAQDTLGLLPTSISVDGASNKLRIEWPDVASAGSQTIAIDITLTIGDTPFADDRNLSLLFLASTKNTPLTSALNTSSVKMHVRAPDMVIEYGISASDNPLADASIIPAVPVNSDISVSDAGDKLTLVITAENIGGSDAYNILLTSGLVTGLTAPVIVSVTDGLGANLAYSGDLFAAGLLLTDPLPKNDGSKGPPLTTDTVIITYTADIDSQVNPNEILTPASSVVWDASSTAATSFPGSMSDVMITMEYPAVVTSLDSVTPQGNPGSVVVGDTVTYRTRVTLPEGETEDLVLIVALPAGFQYVNASLSVDTSGFSGTVDAGPTVGVTGSVGSGQTINIAFDSPVSTSVTNDNNTANNAFDFTFDALVADDAALTALTMVQSRSLSANLTYTAQTGSAIQDSVQTNFSEHVLAVTSSFSPATGLMAGDLVTVTIDLTNTGTAPAYDILITDTLNGDLFDITSVVVGTTPAGFSYGFVSPTVTYTGSVALAVGANIAFTYTAVVKNSVVTGSTYASNVVVTGDSQDGAAADPERVSNDNGSAMGSISALTIDDFSLLASSESWSSDVSIVEAAIGEVLTYGFRVSVPEGISLEDTINPIIDIDLPAGVEYLSGSALISAFNSNSLQGSNLSGALAPIPTSDTSITPVVNGAVLEFDLGDITNSDDDADTEQLLLSFDVLVKNITVNARTNIKTLTANINYNNLAGSPQTLNTNAGFTVVEADLSVVKSASPLTVNGGDVITFTSVVTNNASANASRGWEWQIDDTLPVGLQSPVLVSATLSRGATDVSACFSFSGNSLISDQTCLSAGERYLDTGETVTLVYTATVDVGIGFEVQLINSLVAQITSLPGAQGTASATPGISDSDTGERTGSGNNNDSGQMVNDLTANDSVTVISNKPDISLTSGASNLTILDTRVITAIIGIPVGITGNFVFTYDLPPGMTYTGTPVVIIEPGSNFTASNAPATNLSRGDDPLVFDFGTLSNNHTGAQNLSIAIEVEADNILANQGGVSLSVTGSVSYDNASSPPVKTIIFDLVEANLLLTDSIVSGASGSDAGDSLSYRVTLTNTSIDATAYRVNLTDIMPTELLGSPDGSGSGSTFDNILLTNPGNLAVLTNTATILASLHASIITTNDSDDTLSWPEFDLPATASITIDYDVVIDNTANAGDLALSSVSANYNSLLLGSGRDSSDSSDDDDGNLNNYGESVTQALTIDSNIALQQVLSPGQGDSTFTIGETVSYDIQVDIIEGITESLVLTNLLPSGLSFMSASIIASAQISYSGTGTEIESPVGTFSFDFGDVSNTADADLSNDHFILRLLTRVNDDLANSAGVTLDNIASVTSLSGAAGPDTEQISLVEPNLVLSISTPISEVSLGDTLLLTLVLDHDLSTSDAFEVSFDINIAPGLTYVPSSHSGDGSLDVGVPGLIGVNLGSITLAEDNKSFTVELSVDNDAQIDKLLTIEIDNGHYSSLAGTPTVERSYNLSGSTSITSRSLSFIDVGHTVDIVIDNGESGVLEPGDVLEYTLVITNTGPAVNSVIYQENIPNHTFYDVSTVANTSQGSVDDANLPLLTFDIGAMNTNDVVVLHYRVIINSGVSAGTQIRAQGVVDSELTVEELSDSDGNDSNGDQATIIYVQGTVGRLDALYIQQTALWVTDLDTSGDISPLDTMKLSYFIQNLSPDALTNVSVSETLPGGITYVPGTAVVTGSNTIDVTGNAVAVAIGSLQPGQIIVGEYSVTIDAPLFDTDGAPDSEMFSHLALGDSDQTAAVTADSNGDPSDGAQLVRYSAVDGGTSAPAMDIYLSWSLVNDLDGDGWVDPNDQILYEFVIINIGSASGEASQLHDVIPVNTGVLGGSGYTSQGIVVADAPLSVNIGDIPPGALVNVGVIVTVDASTPDGTIIANQGLLSGTNFSHVLSDDNADASDGRNPTLLLVNLTSSSGQPQLTMSLASSSFPSTSANDFIQGERLTLDVNLIIPTGRTQDLTLDLVIPDGLALTANSGELMRVFDTGMTASGSPAGINSVAANVFVDVGAALIQNGQAYSMVLGSVINSDADSNNEQYLLRFELTDTGLVPLSAAEDFPVQASVTYVDNIKMTTSSVELTLRLLNRFPVAMNDTYSDIIEDSAGELFDVLLNDFDQDTGHVVSLLSLGETMSGAVATVTEGHIFYMPKADFFGVDTLSYTITDNAGGQSTALVTINVSPVNDLPVAVDDGVIIFADETINISVLNNDFDIDGDPLSVSAISASSANIVINSDSSISFTPPQGFIGEIIFTYTISDGAGSMAQAQVNVTVQGLNLSPIAVDDVYQVNDWLPINIQPLNNDSDPDNDVISLVSANVDIGAVELLGNVIIYTPVQGFNGEVIIEYLVTDPHGLMDTGLIRIFFDIDENSLFPIISLPDDLCDQLVVSADALYTRIDIGTATATDRFGNLLPVSIINNNLLFPPGNNKAYWQAVDSEGRTSVAAQNICVRPLVSFNKDQTVSEGERVVVGVYLNGQSETYPLVISYQLSGSAQASDYLVATGELVIESGTDTQIMVTIVQDDLSEEDETLTFTLDPELNRASQFTHSLRITEGNIAPKVSLTASQNNEQRLTVTRSGGAVTIDSNVYDANITDTWIYSWESELNNISPSTESFVFQPESLTLGVYRIDVTVTDNGIPALDDKASLYIHLVDSLEVLTDADSDGDLIPDNIEGYQDSDGDGTPDYLDSISECNVLFEHSAIQNQYLVEGDPGICLRRGQFTFNTSTGGALLADKGDDYGDVIPVDTLTLNVGGIMDFIAYGLPDNSQEYRIVTPIRSPIPFDAVYRKYRSETAWGDFVEDDKNSLWSTQGEPGYCPPTGSVLWQPGLTLGDWCVQLIIEDGGPNDDDMVTNGTIIDPGFVGTKLTDNLAPNAVDDSVIIGVNEEVFIEILVNDTDPDGDELTIISANVNFGTVTIENNGVFYRGALNIIGQDIIHYGISDGKGGADFAMVKITITANRAPVALDDNIQVIQGDNVDINVLLNDYDLDGDAIHVTSASALYGSVTINNIGVITYVSNADFAGFEEITYQIQDTFGGISEAKVYITVIAAVELASRTDSSGGSLALSVLLYLFLFAYLNGRRHRLHRQASCPLMSVVFICLFTSFSVNASVIEPKIGPYGIKLTDSTHFVHLSGTDALLQRGQESSSHDQMARFELSGHLAITQLSELEIDGLGIDKLEIDRPEPSHSIEPIETEAWYTSGQLGIAELRDLAIDKPQLDRPQLDRPEASHSIEPIETEAWYTSRQLGIAELSELAIDKPQLDRPQIDRPEASHSIEPIETEAWYTSRQLGIAELRELAIDKPQIDRPQIDKPQLDRPEAGHSIEPIEPETWYIGGQFGIATTQVSSSGLDALYDLAGVDASSTQVDDSGASFSVFVGYQLNSYFSLEAGYMDLGERSVWFSGKTTDIEAYYDLAEHVYPETASGLSLSVLTTYPINEQFSITAKLGYFVWQMDAVTFELSGGLADNLANQISVQQPDLEIWRGHDSRSGHSIWLGAELSYQVDQKTQVYIGYQHIPLDRDEVGIVSLGVRYSLDLW